MIDLNVGPLDLRINSAGSDASLGPISRQGSSSSLSSTENTQLNSGDEKTPRADSVRERSSSSSRARSRGKSTDKRTGSAGSDSDNSMGSTLKADIPQTLNIDMGLSNLEQDDAITYEQLQTMIETVLVECGYYSVSPKGRERTPPLAGMDSVRQRLLASTQFMN